MFTREQINTLTGRTLYDRDDSKIGEIGQVWEDRAGQPMWVSVKTGLFGLKESLVPLRDAGMRGDDVVVPLEKAQVKDAPNVDVSHDEPLYREEVERLYQHYGMSWGDAGDSANSDSASGDAMTRSEERLNVDTRTEPVGQARLRKYVVTERQQVEVPVRREEVRLEREPITDANSGAAYGGPDLTESEHEVTVRAERPVVGTETVPVERVRLGKQTVTEQQTVGAEVRKERVEADLPTHD
jgi:uncharacterized protein (TIGR02271 family)